ncbi:hypothetical protein OG786_24930 [Streptomyces sp. NBC_00101]|uniref:BBE domain-containing protein n=1 Tax=Streptomyces sp. NBC_00101 TaxID=2975651 RepID=UPI003243F198
MYGSGPPGPPRPGGPEVTADREARPWADDAVYLDFIGHEGHERVGAAFGEDTCARLADVKRRCDPEGMCRFHHNIRPAADLTAGPGVTASG